METLKFATSPRTIRQAEFCVKDIRNIPFNAERPYPHMNILFSEKRDMVRTLTHNAESLFSMKMSLLGALSLFPFGDEKSFG